MLQSRSSGSGGSHLWPDPVATFPGDTFQGDLQRDGETTGNPSGSRVEQSNCSVVPRTQSKHCPCTSAADAQLPRAQPSPVLEAKYQFVTASSSVLPSTIMSYPVYASYSCTFYTEHIWGGAHVYLPTSLFPKT